MEFSRILRWNRFLLVANIIILVVFAIFFIASFKESSYGRSIEAKHIVLKGENGRSLIEMQATQEGPVLAFYDQNGQVRLQMQGGSFPAVILKNEGGEIVGTLFTLKDGGAGIGLGDGQGEVATFVRGGSSPSIGLYHNSSQPNVALGITNDVPHFFMFPTSGKDGMMIHGGEPTSLLFVDEEGEIPVVLSKYGLIEHKSEKDKNQEPKDKKSYYSWDGIKKSLHLN